jgi:hypothetical protein
MGRVASSDVLSGFLAVVVFWLLWQRNGKDRGLRALVAGWVWGASFSVRTTNPILAAPLIAAWVAGRRRGWRQLIVGAGIGLTVRFVGCWIVFGDPLYTRPSYGFSAGAAVFNVPFYLFVTLVMVPGGLLALATYRGRWWRELLAGGVLLGGVYSFYNYAGATSGFPFNLILGPRFLIPLVPVLAVAAALRPWRSGFPGRRIAVAATGVVVVLAVSAQVPHHRLGSRQRLVRDAILEHVPTGATLITNSVATDEYIGINEGITLLDRAAVVDSSSPPIPESVHPLYVALVDKETSEFWRNEAGRNDDLVRTLAERHRLVPLHEMVNARGLRLRVWRLD